MSEHLAAESEILWRQQEAKEKKSSSNTPLVSSAGSIWELEGGSTKTDLLSWALTCFAFCFHLATLSSFFFLYKLRITMEYRKTNSPGKLCSGLSLEEAFQKSGGCSSCKQTACLVGAVAPLSCSEQSPELIGFASVCAWAPCGIDNAQEGDCAVFLGTGTQQ